MRAHVFIGVIINMVILASVEGADWPMYRYDPGRTAYQPAETVLHPGNVGSLQQRWSFRPSHIGDPDLSETGVGFTASPTVYEGIVYVGHNNGLFYALDKWTGQLRWRYPPVGVPPLAAEPTDACPRRGKFGIGSSAAIARDVQGRTAVIFGAPDASSAGDGFLHALDAATGHLIWRSDRIASAAHNEHIGWSSPVIANGKVYIGIASHCDNPVIQGRLIALDLQTGRRPAGFSPFFTVPLGFSGGGIWSSPTADPVTGRVFTTTGNPGFRHILSSPEYTNSVVALDGNTGHPFWAFQTTPPPQDLDTDYRASPLLVNASCGQLLIAVPADGWVYAIEQNTGQVRWTFPENPIIPRPGPHGPKSQYASAATVGDLVFTTARSPGPLSGRFARTLFAFDACATSQASRIRWAIRLTGLYVGPPSVANGVLYVGTNLQERGGTFYAIDAFNIEADRNLCLFEDLEICEMQRIGIVPTPKVLFQHHSPGAIVSEPTITDSMVYVTSMDGVIRALHAP